MCRTHRRDEAEMIQTDVQVIALDPLGPLVRVVMDGPEIAAQLAPGRFVLADLGDYLRKVLFPAALMLDSDKPGGRKGFPSDEIEVLAPPTHRLTKSQPGDRINLLGPLGRGYTVAPEATRLLLVADTPHLPVLLPLALEALGRGCNVALILSADTAADLFPVRLLPPALEVYAVTGDGSASREGSAVEPFRELVRWASSVCIAHDATSYPAFATIVRQVRIDPSRRFAQALVVPSIACGVGACRGCAVETSTGPKRACIDGPVFDLLELL
jgi:dihydroorotate dehydrogenase electron transfer subunit